MPPHELEHAVDLRSRLRAPYELARGRVALVELALETARGDEAAGAAPRTAATTSPMTIV